MFNPIKTLRTMKTKKFYTTPETEVFNIQTESMCDQSFGLSSDNPITGVEDGFEKAANGRDIEDMLGGIGDLW